MSENQRCSVPRQKAITATSTVFIMQVDNAGLSLPLMVGHIATIKSN